MIYQISTKFAQAVLFKNYFEMMIKETSKQIFILKIFLKFSNLFLLKINFIENFFFVII